MARWNATSVNSDLVDLIFLFFLRQGLRETEVVIIYERLRLAGVAKNPLPNLVSYSLSRNNRMENREERERL